MKPYLTIDEQISLLKDRNMIIDDYNNTHDFLLRKNYYNSFSIYGKYFLKDPGQDDFISTATSTEIQAVYYFDKEVRAILFKKLMEVETNIKSTFTSFYCQYHPYPEDLFNRNCYREGNHHNNNYLYLTNKMQRKISSNYQTDSNKTPFNNSIDHYMRVHNQVPLWVLINYLSFGDICTFYKIAHDNIRMDVAKSFRDFAKMNNPNSINLSLFPDDFEKFIFAFKDLRNVIAHDVSLKSFKLRTSLPYYDFIHSQLNVKPGDSRQSLYDVFVIMSLFLSRDSFFKLSNTIRKRIHVLSNKLESIDVNIILKSHGFPEQWHKQPKKIQSK